MRVRDTQRRAQLPNVRGGGGRRAALLGLPQRDGRANAHRMPDVAFCLLSAGIFRGRKSLYDVLAIGALAVSACVYDGLEEVFLVGFTPAEVETLQTLIEELLAAETREAAQAKLFERLAPAVKQMHLDCTAGILEPNLEVGYAVAMQAAAAGGEPIQAGPVAGRRADGGGQGGGHFVIFGEACTVLRVLYVLASVFVISKEHAGRTDRQNRSTTHPPYSYLESQSAARPSAYSCGR